MAIVECPIHCCTWMIGTPAIAACEPNECRLSRARNNRHTFAVTKLLRWYQEGADIDRRIAALSTYLGHVKVTDTYWYLTAVPELMAVASARYERYAALHQGGRP